MSRSDPFRFLDIQKSSTKEIIDVIKNDELFSSCCKIIEEKKLNGQDILNLHENQILAWNPPLWLVRNLMSLKSTLSKHLESKKQNFQSKFDTEKNFSPHGSNQGESEALYDDDNYLKPTALNASVKKKIAYGKPLPKLPPSVESNSSKYRKDRNKSPSSFRNPIPPPREDTEENVYEPAPNSSALTNNKLSIPSSSSNAIEEDNVYETPPILPQKFQQQNTSKFYLNTPLSKNKNVDKLEKNYTNIEINRDFSPPLPLRSTSFQKTTTKDTHNRKNPTYTNVLNQLLNSSISDGNEVILKKFSRSSPNRDDSNMVFPEVPKGERLGISGRPLPPLPRRNSMHESRMVMNEKQMLHEDKIAGEELKYYSLRKTSFPTEILGKSGNTEESLMPLQSDILQELRKSNILAFKHGRKNNDDWTSDAEKYNEPPLQQNNKQEDMKLSNSETKINTNFLSEIKKIKLRSTKYSLQKDKNTNDDSGESLSTLISNELDTTKSSLVKPISSKLNINSIGNESKFRSTRSTVMSNKNFMGHSAGETETVLENKQQLTKLINKKVKSNRVKAIVSSEDSFSSDENDDDQPSYINTVESKKVSMSGPHAQMLLQKKSKDISEGEDQGSVEFVHAEDTKKNFESSFSVLKGTNQNSNHSIFNDLANRISTVKLKPTTQIQKKEISLNQDDNEEILPEYINHDELRKPKTNSVNSIILNKMIKNSHPPWVRDMTSTTPTTHLKQTPIETEAGESSSHENDNEDLPEYGNREEIIKFVKQPLTVAEKSSSSSTIETSNHSPISQLISELSKKSLKPAINSLDDKAAEILKKKLLERKQGNTEYQKETTSKHSSKPLVKLALPPSTLPTNFSTEYLTNTTQEKSEDEFLDDYDEFDGVYNLNNEKYFRNTDRKGAMILLRGLENGAFVLRPSNNKNFFLSITVKTENKYYNLGIKQNESKYIFCGEGNMRSPDFSSIEAFLEYYERFPLMLQGENGVAYVYLRKVLPEDRF